MTKEELLEVINKLDNEAVISMAVHGMNGEDTVYHDLYLEAWDRDDPNDFVGSGLVIIYPGKLVSG